MVQRPQNNSRARSTSSESSLQALFRNNKSGFDEENGDQNDSKIVLTTFNVENETEQPVVLQIQAPMIVP